MATSLTRLFLLFLCLPIPIFSQDPVVYRARIDGVINPASAEYLLGAIEKANASGASCLILEMDTPGGLMKSMNVMVKSILASEVPVIVYVSPGGSHCASAGVFITMASHVAVMAPGTNIGAAHPVTMGQPGNDSASTVMMEKVTNDAVSFIRSLAEKNKRNADWAENAVRNSVSITETEALRLHVVDTLARNMDSLLIMLDGMTVETMVGKKTIHTAHARIETVEKSWRFDLLDILTDPNIAYILMMLGIYGLFFELYNPGSILPGVIGGICLILAFYSFHTLPINYAGVALILFGVILLLLEIKVTSYGILSIGGVISLLLGSIMLIEDTAQFGALSWSVIIPVILTTAIFFLAIVGIGVQSQRRQVTTGLEGMIGSVGKVIDLSADGKTGNAYVHGEIWKIYSESPLTKDSKVRVLGVDSDLKLKVQIA